MVYRRFRPGVRFFVDADGPRALSRHKRSLFTESLRPRSPDEVPVQEGEVIDAPFDSNEEAMALWDAILGSFVKLEGGLCREAKTLRHP